MNNFPDFDGKFPEKKELQNSVNLRIKETRTWTEYLVVVTAIPSNFIYIGIKNYNGYNIQNSVTISYLTMS